MNLLEHAAFRASCRIAIDAVLAERGMQRKDLCKQINSQMRWLTDQITRGLDFLTAWRICTALDISLDELMRRVIEAKEANERDLQENYVCRGDPMTCGHSYEDHKTGDGHCKICDYGCEGWTPMKKVT